MFSALFETFENTIVHADVYTAQLIYSLRSPFLIVFFLVITALGSGLVVLCIGLSASLVFLKWKKSFYALNMWLAIIGSSVSVVIAKALVSRVRPDIAFYTENSFSFPSAHAMIAVVLYGFLIYVIWKQYKRIKHAWFYILSGYSIIILIGVSRIYLGVHYLSDVIGGYMLGICWLVIGIAYTEHFIHKYKQHHH